MRRDLSVLLVLALVMTLCVPAFAAGNTNDLAYLGIDELDAATEVDVTDGVILTRNNVPLSGMTVSDISKVGVTDADVHNTTDETQVLASETGKVFIAKYDTKYQLPAAAAGLTYTFTAGADVEIEVQVNTTPDTIYAYNDDGDKSGGVIETSGTNTTGNSVTLTSDGTDWYITSRTGTWEDGGAWQMLDMGAQE